MLAFLGDTRRDLPAAPATRYIRHHVTTLRIEVTSPDSAAARGGLQWIANDRCRAANGGLH
jgi:hypothetical protein